MLILRSRAGFTLLEVMIVVAIIGIASALAAPSYNAWVARYQLREGISEMQHQLVLARIMAVSRNVPVTVTMGLSNGSLQLTTANAATGTVISASQGMSVPQVVMLNVGPSPAWTTVATATVSFNSMGCGSEARALRLIRNLRSSTVKVCSMRSRSLRGGLQIGVRTKCACEVFRHDRY